MTVPSPITKRRRRRLREFVGLGVVCAVWIGIVFAIIRSGEPAQQERARDMIPRLGGRVTSDAFRYPGFVSSFSMPRDSLGADFGGTSLHDADLVYLQRVPRLYSLNLNNTCVTDAGLAEVAKLEGLAILALERTAITDEGLCQLSGAKGLAFLDLRGTQVSDAGMTYLGGLPVLRYLDLCGTQVSDAGLEHLNALQQLEHLYVGNTQVTETGIERFKKPRPHLDMPSNRQSP